VAITPEQVKNREFTVRLKGYDPEEVRSFLAEVAAAYRATIRDQGAQWALSNISDDMAAVLRAAHETAEKVLAQAETQADELRSRAEAAAALRDSEADENTRLAVEVLKRAQGRADRVAQDCLDARKALEDARHQAQEIVGAALAEATGVRADVGELAERERRAADAEARLELASKQADEAKSTAATILFEAEQTAAQASAALTEANERAATILRAAEREARLRAQQLEEQGRQIAELSESEARVRVQAVLSEGQRQVDTLEAEEQRLRERIMSVQNAFDSVVTRLLTEDDTTLDLTDEEPMVVIGGSYAAEGGHSGEGPADAPPAPDTDLVRRMVSAAVGSARSDDEDPAADS
jgi:DivIVA domain-containing protein